MLRVATTNTRSVGQRAMARVPKRNMSQVVNPNDPAAVERAQRDNRYGFLACWATLPILTVVGAVALKGHHEEHDYWHYLEHEAGTYIDWHPALPVRTKRWPWREPFQQCTFFNFKCRKEIYQEKMAKWAALSPEEQKQLIEDSRAHAIAQRKKH
jgi:hypothetical protein